jgi:hypothetical protein
MTKSWVRESQHTPVYINSDTREPTMNVAGSVSFTNGLYVGNWDYLSFDGSGTYTDVYVYKSGGASGTTLATITITYTTAAKTVLVTVIKT